MWWFIFSFEAVNHATVKESFWGFGAESLSTTPVGTEGRDLLQGMQHLLAKQQN